jgi:ATP-binding cassette subfamily C protein
MTETVIQHPSQPMDDDALARVASQALMGVLDARAATTHELTGSSLIDSLVECGAAVGTSIAPGRLAQARRSTLTDPTGMARQLRLPVRPVVLNGTWWRGDSGPYLVTRPDGSYAAAIPGSRGYDLVIAGRRVRVTKQVASELGSAAWTVTPELPAGSTSIRQVLARSLGAGSRFELMCAGVAAVALAVMGIAVPWLSGVVVGQLVPLNETSRIIWIGTILILVSVATFGIAMVQSFLVQRLTTRLDVRATAIVLLRLVDLPLSFFRRYSAGDLLQRLQGFDEVTAQLASSIVVIGSTLLLAVSGLFVMFVVSPPLAGLVLFLLLIISGFAALMVWALVRARSSFVRSSLTLSGMTLSLFTGIAKLRVAGAERRMHTRWVLVYASRQVAASQAALGGQRLGIVAVLAPTLVTFVVVIGNASGATPLDLGQFTSFVAAAGQTSGALASMLGPIALLLGLLPLIKAVQPILTEPTDVTVDAIDPGELAGEVELASVSFSYGPGEPDVLRDVSLRVAPGEFVAVVGPSGSGKSTLVRLLIGLEKPTGGGVLYDGRPLDRLDADAVRRQIGVVVQSAQLASGTLLENIVGASTRTEEDAWEAARLAGIAADIEAMPMKMRTLVSDGASTFSGGQKQRIMLARALVRRPRIVVLDEATSTLDNRTQATVADSLRNLGATRIVVAHRLSTITGADRIIVLDEGGIAESGTYDELVELGSLFAQLSKRQVL